MTAFRMGRLGYILTKIEPGDVLCLGAKYAQNIDNQRITVTGFLYTAVVRRTLETILFTHLAPELEQCSLRYVSCFVITTNVITFNSGDVQVLEYYINKPVFLFKYLRMDLANEYLDQLEAASKYKN